MAGIIVFFNLNEKKLSPHMAHIIENINSSNHNIFSYDKMIKIIVNLVSKKYENNINYTCQLKCMHSLLLMIIENTPEKDLSNVDWK